MRLDLQWPCHDGRRDFVITSRRDEWRSRLMRGEPPRCSHDGCDSRARRPTQRPASSWRPGGLAIANSLGPSLSRLAHDVQCVREGQARVYRWHAVSRTCSGSRTARNLECPRCANRPVAYRSRGLRDRIDPRGRDADDRVRGIASEGRHQDRGRARPHDEGDRQEEADESHRRDRHRHFIDPRLG